MITREQATEMRGRVWSDGRTIEIPTLDLLECPALLDTVVALHDQAEHSALGKQALIDEMDALTTRLRLAEASVSLLRADIDSTRAELDTFAAFHRTKTDALALELRRFRAAEAPGTDDEAVAPWESVGDEDRPIWRYWRAPGRAVLVSRRAGKWSHFNGEKWTDDYDLALDAMRAAVPGSV